MKLVYTLIVLVGITFVAACEKPENPTATELIEQGGSIADLIEKKGADSLLGQKYYWGYIFYVDTAEKSALIISESDVSIGTGWGCNGAIIGAADSVTFGNGLANTDAIVNSCAEISGAAFLTKQYSAGDFSEWYLPCQEELALVFSVLGNHTPSLFSADDYWTSSQYSGTHALFVSLFNGTIGSASKADNKRVRAICKVF